MNVIQGHHDTNECIFFLNTFLSNWIVQTLLVFLSKQQLDPKHSNVYKAIPDVCRYFLIMDRFINNVMGQAYFCNLLRRSIHALHTHTHTLNNQTFSTISSSTFIQVTITRARDVCLGVNAFMIMYWLILEVCEMNRTRTCT